jgi:hypothetical protein
MRREGVTCSRGLGAAAEQAISGTLTSRSAPRV